ncbi:MAG TPA: hypothetical protein VLJ58_21425 [Ramlibacter sp.]|nr:hypothetical protein [Ramlibacter sp.]
MAAASVAGTAITAYSGSKAAKGAYESQAQVARNNATIAGWQADDALARGDRAASAVRMKTSQLKGRQRATMAANGVDLGAGSALNILDDTDYFGEIDANTVKDNAAREAWALRNQAQGFTYEAGAAQARASNESPLLAAGTSMLTSAGRVADRWYAGSK